MTGLPLTCTGAPTSPAALHFLPPPGGHRHQAPVSTTPSPSFSTQLPRTSLDPLAEPRQTPGLLRRLKTTDNAKLKHIGQKNTLRLSVHTPCTVGMLRSVNCSFSPSLGTQPRLGISHRSNIRLSLLYTQTNPPPSLSFTSSRPAVCTLSMFWGKGGGPGCCWRVRPNERREARPLFLSPAAVWPPAAWPAMCN